MKTIFALLLSALAFTGCKGFGMHSIPPKHPQYPTSTAERDTNHFAFAARFSREDFALRPFQSVAFPSVSTPPDDCGACVTNAIIINPSIDRVVTASFDLVEPVNAFGVDMTTNGTTWQTVYQEAPHLWIGLGHKRFTFTTSQPFAFYRAWCRNEP